LIKKYDYKVGKGEVLMKKILCLFLLIAFVNMYSPVLAKTIEVKEGTRVPITVQSEYTSKNVIAGQKINAVIDEDVIINNVTIFKKGDNAILNISDAKKAGFIGIPGMVEVVNGSVTDMHGDKHSIDFNQKIVGEEKTWPKVCVGCGIFVILAPLVLFGFVKGGQAKISPSKIIEVSTRNDFGFITEKL
jgi:hypothetical protein